MIALSVLVADGKELSSDELKTMLNELAASTEPAEDPQMGLEIRSTTCIFGTPRPEGFEYVCGKCGTHTAYPQNCMRMADILARFREDTAGLKNLGLDITLDESALCPKCAPREYWASADSISGDGEILGDYADIRLEPRIDTPILCRAGRALDALVPLPSRQGDPMGWVRIDEHGPILLSRMNHPVFAWVINGRRTSARFSDAAIMKAFLTGRNTWERDYGEEVPLRKYLSRLRELLDIDYSSEIKVDVDL